LHNWKKQAMEGIKSCFNGKNTTKKPEQNDLLNELYQQIGQQKMELDWLKKNQNYSVDWRHLIDQTNELSISR
jgi:putative transposase